MDMRIPRHVTCFPKTATMRSGRQSASRELKPQTAGFLKRACLLTLALVLALAAPRGLASPSIQMEAERQQTIRLAPDSASTLPLATLETDHETIHLIQALADSHAIRLVTLTLFKGGESPETPLGYWDESMPLTRMEAHYNANGSDITIDADDFASLYHDRLSGEGVFIDSPFWDSIGINGMGLGDYQYLSYAHLNNFTGDTMTAMIKLFEELPQADGTSIIRPQTLHLEIPVLEDISTQSAQVGFLEPNYGAYIDTVELTQTPLGRYFRVNWREGPDGLNIPAQMMLFRVLDANGFDVAVAGGILPGTSPQSSSYQTILRVPDADSLQGQLTLYVHSYPQPDQAGSIRLDFK